MMEHLRKKTIDLYFKEETEYTQIGKELGIGEKTYVDVSKKRESTV